MNITLEQHGGHLPMRRNSKVEIDTDSLPEATAREMERCVEAASKETASAPTASVPDGMTYVITLDDGRELRQSDAALGNEFSALMDLLNSVKRR
jgi:hypothetical protein